MSFCTLRPLPVTKGPMARQRHRGVAFPARGLLVTDLYKDDLAELAEGGWGRKTPAAPERLVALPDSRDELTLCYGLDIPPLGA